MPAAQLASHYDRLPDDRSRAPSGFPTGWKDRPAAQQPPWPDRAELDAVCDHLAELPGLTEPGQIALLTARLAEVQQGRRFLLQAGDCAEPLGTAGVDSALAKRRALGRLARFIADRIGVPVVPVGRLAGQYAKPRSEPTELVGGLRLPVFRGEMVNGPAPDPSSRTPDPYRLLSCYYTARSVIRGLEGALWTSHEALILDYEHALTRRDPVTGAWYLLSTHLPWIGQRTRGTDGAHVAFMASIANPVAVKIGPDASPGDVLGLCAALDPDRVPGRLVLITRLGAALREVLPGIAAAVRDSGRPVAWVCDPMHANTVKTATGVKTRRLDAVLDELRGFFDVLQGLGQWPGGVHLELAAADVTECVGGPGVPDETHLARRYESLCDPRLNDAQARTVAELIGSLGARTHPLVPALPGRRP